ncbi:MAG: phosphotransferase family protein [Nitrospira sp.]|nr:phosphotransferase family protein [Nitrospira sp.]
MEISSSEKYLSLVLNSLENIVMPALDAGDTKATAEIMKGVLLDLIKRERFTPRLLAEHIAQGRVVARSLATLVAELQGTSADGSGAEERPAPSAAGFNALAAEHRDLTARIALLTDQLASLRPRTSDNSRQQYISALLHQAARWEYAYYSGQRDADATPSPVPPAPKGAPLNRDTLQAFLRQQHPAGSRCAVTAFQSIPGGFGKQTFRITVEADGASETLIVRKSDPTPMVVHGGFFIDQEFHLLKDVAGSDLPVATPLYLGVDVPGVDADFYVMSTLPGKVAGSFLGAASAVIPESVVLHMAELMARLHQLKLETFSTFLSRYGHAGALTETTEACYRRNIAEWREYFAKGDHLPSPFVTYMLDWLEQHVPPNQNPPVLVHGDFNIHNVLAEDGRVSGILDWECAMFGAPEQDLAYIKPIISNHIGWDRFLSHYRASGGPQIDEAAMNFYMAFSSMRLNIVFNKGVHNLQLGVTRDIRYALVEMGLTTEFMKLALASTSGGSA